ncbi:MAG: NUDIX domain-containing protein [Thaumarchaeota archaeon]|nr:NUDIX domain-containing protein [Nitrososphaerota archaeon]
MFEERSAGAVLFIDDGASIKFLVLHYPAGHWDFPKGNIEKGEEPLDTVRREVEEETGIKNIEIIPGFKREIEYYYRRSGELVHKQVIYLLAKTTTRAVTLSAEHQNYAWLDFEKSVDRVTYRNSKTILREAAKFLGEGSKRRGESAQ